MVVIGFSTRPASPVSWVVRKLTRAKCSHAWLMINETFFGRPMVMEATEWGVRLIDAEIFWKRNTIVRVYKPCVDLTDAVRQSGDVLGDIYDFGGLIGMGIVTLVARWLHRKIRNPFQSPHSLFCSEFIMQIMKKGAHPGVEAFEPSTSSPQAEYGFLETIKAAFVDKPTTPAMCFF